MKTKDRILQMLQEGRYQSQIVKALRLTLPNASQHFKRMQGKGYIALQSYSSHKEYLLTEKGLTYLLEKVNPSQPVAQPVNPSQAQKLRIHSLAIAFQLKDRLAPNEPQIIMQERGISYKRSGLRNQASVYTKDYLLTPSSLILYLPELSIELTHDPRLAFQPYITEAIEKAEKHEAKLGIRLRRVGKGVLSGAVIMNHNANTDNPVAKTILEKLSKFEVKDELGNIRLIVDASGGIPEFEAVNAQNAIEDITKVQDQYLATLNGTFDYREVNRLLLETNIKLNSYAEKLNAHIPFFESQTEVNKAILSKLGVKRKVRGGEDASQKRLFE